jgi:iron complex outermembrane receptor protein
MKRLLLSLGWLMAPCALLGAQDSVVVLPPLEATIGRSGLPLSRDGLAATTVVGSALNRGRLGTTLDEALAFVPGVVIANRWNWSLDQRISIRGAGARANFGVRGVQVLLDGVPQTLADGQSQLNLVDLERVDRIDVVRGATSSLHGNAGGGVIAMQTRLRPVTPWEIRAGSEFGSFGSTRFTASAAAGSGPLGGSLSLARFTSEGYRDHSQVEQRRLHAGFEWLVSSSARFTVRADIADDPQARNPGALTLAEVNADPAAAAPNNRLRQADKAVRQHQFALGFMKQTDDASFSVHAWVGGRSLKNPLAAPAPEPLVPGDGIWVGIERDVIGIRSEATFRWGSRSALTAAFDFQRGADDRINRAHTGGQPHDAPFLNQRETVAELGPSLRLVMPLSRELSLRTGGRLDWVTFSVDDHISAIGGGERAMSAPSGDAALIWNRAARTAWLGVGTAFETPTTTELANRSDGTTGLNRDLGPQRSFTVELGTRWADPAISGEAVVWRAITRDAIAPIEDIGGRTFYANTSRITATGLEVGINAAATDWLILRAVGTYSDVRQGDGPRRVPGVPQLVARLGALIHLGDVQFDLDHGITSSIYADDNNTQKIAGWGAGVFGARVSWQPSETLTLFGFAHNAFDRRYIGSVTVNGAFGRVYEPAPGRTVGFGIKAGLH